MINKKNNKIIKEKEKTLLAAWLISLWAPFASGLAFAVSGSITLLADLFRRTLELSVLFSNWLIYKLILKRDSKNISYKNNLEKKAAYSVSIVMIISFIYILYSAINTIIKPTEIKNIYFGLLISIMGFIVNSWFWFKNKSFDENEKSNLFYAQWNLYRSKAIIDLCVFSILILTLIFNNYKYSYLIDPIGSIFIASFLLFSAVKIIKNNLL